MTGIINLDAHGNVENVPREYPNGMAGFGLLSLGSVFGWDVPFMTKVFDRVDASKEGRYCYHVSRRVGNVTNAPALRATVSWYDQPAASSATATLVSDIDLDVLTWSNGDKFATRYPGNNNFDSDSTNTVERSQVSPTELYQNMTVLILVRAKSLGGEQHYSLVITTPNTDNVCDIYNINN